MKNHVYNPLQKLVLVVMLLFAGNAIAQTANNGVNVVSPKASEARMKKPAANPAHTTKAAAPVSAKSTTKETKRVPQATNVVKPANPNTPVKKQAVKSNGPAYGKAAPLNREAQLKGYIADIDAKLPKVKGTAKEATLLSKKASYQKELNDISAKRATLKKN